MLIIPQGCDLHEKRGAFHILYKLQSVKLCTEHDKNLEIEGFGRSSFGFRFTLNVECSADGMDPWKLAAH